ncbi:MAG: sensor histidine kinase [Deltaproteobacteria bacterium]|nr:sensor histidine kinase [Deltaproteobacteria bacterium]
MRLWQWLALALGLAATVPLLLVGGSIALLSRSSLEEQAIAVQRSTVGGVAGAADLWLNEVTERLRLTGEVIDFDSLDDRARLGALRLIYRQLEEVDIVGLYDAEGSSILPEVYLSEAEAQGQRLPADSEDLLRFRSKLPLAEARKTGLAIGRPYLVERKHTMCVAMAAHLPGQLDAVIGVELILTPLQEIVANVPHAEVGVAFIVDRERRVLAHADGALFGTDRPRIDAYLESDTPVVADDGTEWVGTTARLRGIDWVAVVERPRGVALAEANRLLLRIAGILAFALLVAVAMGLGLGRKIGRPVVQISESAASLASGDLSTRAEARGPGEIQDLATAFNAMASALEVSQEEIEAFNRELQDRVDERTEELKVAQAQLLQSRKLAAVGELGAGVAHELNNPLTGILGMAQLMLAKRGAEDPERKFLERIEKDAKRCRDVTMNLLRFSEQGERESRVEFDLREAVESAVSLRRSTMEEAGITLEVDAGDQPLLAEGNLGQIQEAVLALLSNARQAVGEAGRISVTAHREGDFGVIAVIDDGVGIPEANLSRVFEPFFSTKSDWRSPGLGLSVTHQTLQSHGGRITIESTEGEGTEVRLRLPLRAAGRGES